VNFTDLWGLDPLNVDQAPMGGTLIITSAWGPRITPNKERDPDIWETERDVTILVQGGKQIITVNETSKVQAKYISQHKGVDLISTQGASTDVLAIKDGTVLSSSYDSTYGANVQVISGDVVYKYSHIGDKSLIGTAAERGLMNELPPSGSIVAAGDKLGSMGNTGMVAGKNGGYHLDLTASLNGVYIDPLSTIDPSIVKEMVLGPGVYIDEAGNIRNQLECTRSYTIISTPLKAK